MVTGKPVGNVDDEAGGGVGLGAVWTGVCDAGDAVDGAGSGVGFGVV